MKDGRPETLEECLKVMEADGGMPEKWRALALVLREMLGCEGYDMDASMSEPEEVRREKWLKEGHEIFKEPQVEESRGRAERGWFSWMRHRRKV